MNGEVNGGVYEIKNSLEKGEKKCGESREWESREGKMLGWRVGLRG